MYRKQTFANISKVLQLIYLLCNPAAYNIQNLLRKQMISVDFFSISTNKRITICQHFHLSMLMCPISPALGPQIQPESQNVVGNKSGSASSTRDAGRGEEEASLLHPRGFRIPVTTWTPVTGGLNTEKERSLLIPILL